MKFTSYVLLLTFFLQSTLPGPKLEEELLDWQTLEAGIIKIHWYEGDMNFGQDALEATQAGLESIGNLFSLDLEGPIEIFIYANAADLQNALVSGKETWVAGHADPELGIARVLIEPGPPQRITMEQRIPHELMHVMLYRQVGAGYKMIPVWLREGLATRVELYPNVDYDRVLKEAAASDALIPLSDLCLSFPNDPAQAFLAYSESGSFTAYLHKTYGPTGLLNLASIYAAGTDCERGTERAFGASLSNLELNWRSSVLGQATVSSTLQNIAPYLVLLGLILIIPLFGIANTFRKRNSL